MHQVSHMSLLVYCDKLSCATRSGRLCGQVGVIDAATQRLVLGSFWRHSDSLL